LTEPELLAHLNHCRAKYDMPIVMTNGVFDLLHVGHVRYLDAARDIGPLLVAVNDDASARRLKGDGRPVNALADRMEMLLALKCVSWVISFSEDTPERLIEQVRPDVLVKGGDYKPEQIAGRQYAGKVLVLPYHAGYSTTGTLRELAGPVAS
jgi:D-beta-D-heptose 7-phosphate kinase/D-beta-D-heptose 1-phosphate adenosyltransferase